LASPFSSTETRGPRRAGEGLRRTVTGGDLSAGDDVGRTADIGAVRRHLIASGVRREERKGTGTASRRCSCSRAPWTRGDGNEHRRRRPSRTGRGVALAVLAAALLSAFPLFDSASDRKLGRETGDHPEGEPASRGGRDPSEGRGPPHPLAFRALVLLTFSGGDFTTESYAFPAPPSAFEAWRRLVHGDVIKYEVMVSPGATSTTSRSWSKRKTWPKEEAFLATAASPSVLRRLGIPGRARKGYLFPDSYIFVKPITPEEILEFMVRQFRRESSPGCGKTGEGGGPFPAPGR